VNPTGLSRAEINRIACELVAGMWYSRGPEDARTLLVPALEQIYRHIERDPTVAPALIEALLSVQYGVASAAQSAGVNVDRALQQTFQQMSRLTPPAS
jgi:hypothetical protein